MFMTGVEYVNLKQFAILNGETHNFEVPFVKHEKS